MRTTPLHALHRTIAIAACAVLTACAATSTDTTRERIALVIGNGSYESAPALNNPPNDAADMCAVLRNLGFTTLCHVDLQDRAAFDASVKEYVDRLGPASIGVVYYSGHGVQARGANFLIPTQVSPKAAAENPLRVLYGVEDLFARLREKPTKFQFVIFDACRTDLLAQNDRPAGGRGQDTRSMLLRSLDKAGASNGLAAIQDAPVSTMVLYATSAKDAAFDGAGRNSPLTKHVLANIGARNVNVNELIRRVTAGVEMETARDYRKRQTPAVYGWLGSDFCFAGCGNTQANGPTPAF